MKIGKWILLDVICLVTASAMGQEPPQPQPRIQPTAVPAPVALPAPTSPDQSLNRPLGVEEAVRIALAHQTAVQIAKAQFEAAKARTREAQSGQLPNLSVNAGYSKNYQTTGVVQSSSGYTAGATLSQLIFDFNVTRDSIRQAKALESSQFQLLSQAESDAVLAAKQAFYTLAQNERLSTVAESNLHDRDAQFALAKARFDEGLGAPADVVSAQTNVDTAVLQVTQAHSAVLSSRVNLAQALGIDPLTPITIQESTEPDQDQTLPALIGEALSQRPEMLAARASLVAASLGASIAGKSTTPSIYLNLGTNGQGTSGITTTNRSTIGVSFSWSLYDGGLAAGKVSEARANEVVSRTQLEQTTQNVTTDVTNTYIALKTAVQAVPITAKEVANAQESVRLAEGRYKAGIATFLEVIDAEATLTQAKINQVNAITTVQVQRAALLHAVGFNPFAKP